MMLNVNIAQAQTFVRKDLEERIIGERYRSTIVRIARSSLQMTMDFTE